MSQHKNVAIRQPWMLVVYLLAVTLTAFLLPPAVKPIGVTALIALQLLILAVFRALNAGLIRIFSRLKFLFLFLVGVNALLPGSAGEWSWSVPRLEWQINITGMLSGVLMSAQIALVVLVTHVVRTIGDAASLINGLRSLRVTPLLAYSFDTTLALLDGSLGPPGGGGRGDGSGGGRGGGHGHRHRGGLWRLFGRRRGPGGGTGGGGTGGGRENGSGNAHPAEGGGVLALFRALKQRDLSPLVEKVNGTLSDASKHAARLGLNQKLAHDVGVIGGVAAAMMAFKLVKILPGLPVMQGAKTIFFIPLYILAADRTNSRWGGTIAGGIMGFIAFLNGDSRYGIFEILKHLVPGLAIDLMWPLCRRWPLKIWVLLIVGLIAAAARTSTQFAMILCLGSDNATLLVFPALKLIPNLIAGGLSVLVSYPMLKHLGARAVQGSLPEKEPLEETVRAQNGIELEDAKARPPTTPQADRSEPSSQDTAGRDVATDSSLPDAPLDPGAETT